MGDFKEIKIPQQKHYDSHPLPCILSPNFPITTSSYPSLSSFIESVKTQKPYLESLLHKAGAILFRGFPVNTASDFNQVVEAFGYEEFPYFGGTAARTNVIGRVYTANESPSHQEIPFHHELAQHPESPAKLFFFCEVEPLSDGETAILLSHIVYERMKEKHPEFVEQLEEQGLVYLKTFKEEDDPSDPVGRGWKSTLATNDKSIAEERAAKLGIKMEWLEDGGVRTKTRPIPAIRYDKLRNRKIWFNRMITTESIRKDSKSDRTSTLGDGKPVPNDIIQDCLKVCEEESVAIPWRKGDILLLDNTAVLHARKPTISSRRILASLCK